MELRKKININNNTNNNINNTNITICNNEVDTSKNKEKDKKKIITAFNSILNMTNNKSRNVQQKKNSLESKTAENATNKIFSMNHQPKLDNNKSKLLIVDKLNCEVNMTKNTFSNKNVDNKQISKIVIKPKQPIKGNFYKIISSKCAKSHRIEEKFNYNYEIKIG